MAGQMSRRRQMCRVCLSGRSIGCCTGFPTMARGYLSQSARQDAEQTDRRWQALEHVRGSYSDFGPTLAPKLLAEHHGLTLSRQTPRKCMTEDGSWPPLPGRPVRFSTTETSVVKG
jgi:hypothetical protein